MDAEEELGGGVKSQILLRATNDKKPRRVMINILNELV